MILFMKKKIGKLLIRLVLSLGLLTFFIWMMSRKFGGLGLAAQKFLEVFTTLTPVFLIFAFFLHLVGFFLVSWRWKILLQAQGTIAGYFRLFLIYIQASFFNVFLFSTIGGDTVRALESRKLTHKTSHSIMVVIVERFTGIMGLAIISLIGLILQLREKAANRLLTLIIIAVILVGFSTIFVFFHPRVAPRGIRFIQPVFPKKFTQFLSDACQSVSIYYQKPKSFLFAMLISLFFKFSEVLYYYLITRALNQTPDFLNFMIKTPLMIFLLMVVPTINGLGVRTAGFQQLLDFSTTNALAGEVIDLAMKLAYGLVGGFLFLLFPLPKTPPKNLSMADSQPESSPLQ